MTASMAQRRATIGPKPRIRKGMRLESLIEFLHEGNEVDVQREEPRAQLDDIELPVPALDLADGRLSSPNTLRQVPLTQLQCLATASEQLQKDFVVAAIERLEHGDPSLPTLARVCPYSEWESNPRHGTHPMGHLRRAATILPRFK